jgi:CheY-like chemotaxis protein
MIESGVVKYSALVTDVNLKGPMKGWEIARLLRQIDPAFPVVYMTAPPPTIRQRRECPTAFC